MKGLQSGLICIENVYSVDTLSIPSAFRNKCLDNRVKTQVVLLEIQTDIIICHLLNTTSSCLIILYAQLIVQLLHAYSDM